MIHEKSETKSQEYNKRNFLFKIQTQTFEKQWVESYQAVGNSFPGHKKLISPVYKN